MYHVFKYKQTIHKRSAAVAVGQPILMTNPPHILREYLNLLYWFQTDRSFGLIIHSSFVVLVFFAKYSEEVTQLISE